MAARLKAVPDEMLMMRPAPAAFITGSTARQARNTPRRFTAITRSHSATLISSISAREIGIVANTAALLTRTSMRPKRSTVARAIASVLDSSETSVWRASGSTPSPHTSSLVASAALPSTSATTTRAPLARQR